MHLPTHSTNTNKEFTAELKKRGYFHTACNFLVSRTYLYVSVRICTYLYVSVVVVAVSFMNRFYIG
jgi:hypothetical protein